MKKSNISRRSFIEQLSLGTASIFMAGPLGLYGNEPRPDRILGVALVGLGRYSTRQLGPALKETKWCKLTGVVTGSKEKGEQWAKDYGFPAQHIYSYDTMARMADNKDIDIVYVVTPNGLHAEHAIAAAKAGKHVICEKPMANTVEECDQIIAACKAAKVKLSMGYRLHFDPYHKELMRLAKEKDFGAFTSMTGDRGFVMQNKVWRADKKLAGGGPLMDLGIYVIHGACMAANCVAPVVVTAQFLPKTKPDMFTDVEEGISWTMEFANGGACTAKTSYQHSADKFRAEGPKGWIDFKEHAFTYRGMVVETSRGPINYKPPNQQALQMDDFANCILTNRQSVVSGELGRRDLVIIEAIYKAAATGKRVEVKA
ncbi:Gfo/Idh/MocA family oxidoreductase [Niastella caeni]|uniref:Gfo/Idh/MocA family oxidoreductase n=1 Tax=Niastella caeni TaxID=2569763 RepID=A0A4V4H1N3_9BACT|nr:Gfo/Idh/MocA family oxidoreductase [Niastella caeni]THU41146.1 Gfo/Idh/MocA family oxidoreductase [Niastella caeni]